MARKKKRAFVKKFWGLLIGFCLNVIQQSALVVWLKDLKRSTNWIPASPNLKWS